MTEIRIYYECLKQAEHCIKPIIWEAITSLDHSERSEEIDIKLVKRIRSQTRSFDKYFPNGKNVLRAICSLVTPDIMITGVAHNREIPLAIIELTEAVSTEDHELQRLYGAVAALLAQTFYIKISGAKQSDRAFGGAAYNMYSSPRAFIEKLGYKGFIIAEWQTEEDNPYRLQHLPGLFACPPEIPILRDTIQKSVLAFCQAPSSNIWFQHAVQSLEETSSFHHFMEKVRAAESVDELTATWQARESRRTNKDKLRFFVRPTWIGAKIYRFAHAMDPDRGILTFIPILFSATHEVFGIYALVRLGSDISDEDVLKKRVSDLNTFREKLDAALDKDERDGSSIPSWLKDAIRQRVQSHHSLNAEIDIHDVFVQYADEIQNNRVTQLLAYFLDGVYLNYNGMKLTWDKYALLGGERGKDNFLELVRSKFGFAMPAAPLMIQEVADEVDEDEVTYAMIHHVLIPNNFRVVSISYPGAQGSSAVLPDRGKGLRQARKYLDIIALPPEYAESFDVLLGENKGKFSPKQLEQDIEKLVKYKIDIAYSGALQEFLVKARVIDPTGQLRDIVIGVGFGVGSGNQAVRSTSWRPDEVDFIFRVHGRERWAIGIFRQDLLNLISQIEGKTNFPKCYKVSTRKKSAQISLF